MGHVGPAYLTFTTVFVSVLQHSNTEHCSSNLPNISYQGPTFTSPYVHLEYVRINHAVEIVCCGVNYDIIHWFRLNGMNWEKFDLCKENCSDSVPQANEGGQVLRINSIDSSSNTSFQCALDKTGYPVVNRTTQIFVVRCDELARGPIATIQPSDQDIFSFGGNVTFQCEGYFGCDLFDEGIIAWFVQESKTAEWTWIQPNGTKLMVHDYTKNAKTIKGINLTVHSVESSDLGKKYSCKMTSPQRADSSTSFVVKINKKDPPIDKWKLIWICVGSAVGLVLFFGFIIWRIWCSCGPQIKLRIRQALPDGFIGPKTIDDDRYEYNAILYHADEDTEKAEQIKESLEKQGWKIKISADILGSQRILMQSFMYCEKSAFVMFLYTENLRNDQMANIIFETIIDVKKNKKILVIEINHEIKKSFKEWLKSIKDKKKVQGQNNEIRNGGHDIEIDGVERQEEKTPSEENLGLLQTDFWKGVSTIKWNKNHEYKVLCQIQNKLPKLKSQIQMEKKMFEERKSAQKLSVGSQKPLLSSVRGASGEYSPPPAISPGSCAVFFGEEEELNNPTKYVDRVHEDLIVDVHADGSLKVPVAVDTGLSHILHHEGDLANQDLHNSMADQTSGQNPRAEYRAGTYGESPATSGYGSLEASGSKSLEYSGEHNEENDKVELGQQLSRNMQQTSWSSEQPSRLGILPLSQSADVNSSQSSKHLVSQSSDESGYATSSSRNFLNTDYTVNKDISVV